MTATCDGGLAERTASLSLRADHRICLRKRDRIILAARNYPRIKRLLPHDQESRSRVAPPRRAGKNRRSARLAIVGASGSPIKR